MKNYQAHSPQNLTLTKVLQKFMKMSTPLVQHLLTSSVLRFTGTGIIGSTVHAITTHLTTAHHSTAYQHSTEDLTTLLRPGAVITQCQTMLIKPQMQRLLDRYMNRGSRDGRPEPMDGLRGIRGDDDLMRVSVN